MGRRTRRVAKTGWRFPLPQNDPAQIQALAKIDACRLVSAQLAEECQELLAAYGAHVPAMWSQHQLRKFIERLREVGDTWEAAAVERYADARLEVHRAIGYLNKINNGSRPATTYSLPGSRESTTNLDAARKRKAEAEVAVDKAYETALVLLKRAEIEKNAKGSGHAAAKLARSFRSRKLTSEANKVQTYVAAVSELYSASASVEALSPPWEDGPS